MKDEEMAEESFKKYRTTDEDYEDLNGSEKMLVFNHEYGAEKQYHRLYKEGFLAGLKAGRPQWHDLRENPNDLPDEGSYLVVWQNLRGYRETMIMEYEEDNDDEALHWIDEDGDNWDDNVIAWCEIPTFDKE